MFNEIDIFAISWFWIYRTAFRSLGGAGTIESALIGGYVKFGIRLYKALHKVKMCR